MKAGDRIRLDVGLVDRYKELKDFTVEEFRYCLGIFYNENCREAGDFTPLCSLYERGPYSENAYISNFGEHYTNPVQAWMDIT